MMSSVCEYVAVDVSKAMLNIAMPGANKVCPSTARRVGAQDKLRPVRSQPQYGGRDRRLQKGTDRLCAPSSRV